EIDLLKSVPVISVTPIYLDDGRGVTKFIMNQNINTSLIGVLFVIGLLLISISKEKKENINVLKNREMALISTLITNAFFLTFSFVFVWGFAYIYTLFINSFSTLILYNIYYYYYRYRNSKIL
ncbi:MAG: hypothetical protein RL387_97, partial [Bacteroidota bacterium]